MLGDRAVNRALCSAVAGSAGRIVRREPTASFSPESWTLRSAPADLSFASTDSACRESPTGMIPERL